MDNGYIITIWLRVQNYLNPVLIIPCHIIVTSFNVEIKFKLNKQIRTKTVYAFEFNCDYNSYILIIHFVPLQSLLKIL